MFPLLETFVAVYETGQFSIAADELRVSQSTVSARIAQLEQRLGTSLFERHARADVTATRAGETLYRSAVELLAQWRQTQEDVSRAGQARDPFLLMMSNTAAVALLPRILDGLRSAGALERVDMHVRTANSDDIVEAVELHRAHMGIVEKPVAAEGIIRTALCDDRLVLAGEHAHDPDNPQTVWLLREHGSGVRYYTDLFFSQRAIQPAHHIEISGNASICSCLAAGFGTSLVSQGVVPAGVPTAELGMDFSRRFSGVTPRSGLTGVQRQVCGLITSLFATRLHPGS
ncbi:LysR family transcriptional regulator [Bifidobacterium porcinum]|uniref:LysR family transcriptional regulator n=1 Tax=Bifidobacterium porcinum TaxID=212365 RepID=UPI000529B9E4|nr:LysR family transcriptional regulator [Bifidobacterium porcinum]